MHNVMAERKIFSNILIAIHELKTSNATTNRAIDQGVNIAQDYDSQQIILRVIRADARVHGIGPSSYIVQMKRQAEADFVKIFEKIQEAQLTAPRKLLSR